MISVGNDLVDLSVVDIARTNDKRFYSKFITDAELELYQPDTMPFPHFAWLLWSVKEAVYKYLSRHDPDLIFAPIRILIKNISTPSLPVKAPSSEGTGLAEYNVAAAVATDSSVVHARSLITEEYITTFATTPADFENMHWGTKRIETSNAETQSTLVREFAMEKLNELLPGKEVEIRTNKVPAIFVEGVAMPFMPLTLSHHGYYVCYAFIAK